MATLEQLYQAVKQLNDALATAVATQKFSPKQITIINGLSELSSNLGSVHAGEFLALSKGDDPSNLDAIGSFVSAIGRIFNNKTYHIGGVYNGDLKWGANAVTGELEAGDGAVVLSEHGVSIYDGTTEVGRLGNLNGFLSYSLDTFGIAIGNANHYFTYDAVNGVRVYGAIVSDREILLADRTYYVRTDGNDNNTGLTNTAAGAFLTIQRAVDCAALELDTRQYNITIQVADGTYNIVPGSTSTRFGSRIGILGRGLSGDGIVTIKGNETTPGNVILSMSGDAPISDWGVVFLSAGITTSYFVSGFKLISTAYSSIGVIVSDNSYVQISAIEFGNCLNGYCVGTYYGGRLAMYGSFTYSCTNPMCLMIAGGNSSIILDCDSSAVHTVTGNPNFILACIIAMENSYVSVVSGVSFSGSATGVRYGVSENSIISGQLSNIFFPGDADGYENGYVDTGGQYSTTGNKISGYILPTTIQIFGTGLNEVNYYPVITVPTYKWVVDSNAYFGGYCKDSAAHLSGSTDYEVTFAANPGKYYFRIYGVKTPDAGKINVWIDGVELFGGVDFYADTITYEVCLSSVIKISTGILHNLTLQVSGNNENSSEYVIPISMIEFLRTEETSFTWSWIPDGVLNGKDTYISSANPAVNYSSSDTLYIGEDSSATDTTRSIIRFNFAEGELCPPSNAVISDISLTLTTKVDNSSNSSDLSAYICKRNWAEAGTTWNQFTIANSWSTPGAWDSSDVYTTPVGTISLTASETLDTAKKITLDTTTMQSILEKDITNCYGIYLRTASEADDQYGWYSAEATTEAYRPTFSCTWTFA